MSDITTRFNFKSKYHDSLIVEVSADNESAMLAIFKENDREPMERAILLNADEIDLMIATLEYYQKQLGKTNEGLSLF